MNSVIEGNTEEYLSLIPDEFLDEAKGWLWDIMEISSRKKEEVYNIFKFIPDSIKKDRKLFKLFSFLEIV